LILLLTAQGRFGKSKNQTSTWSFLVKKKEFVSPIKLTTAKVVAIVQGYESSKEFFSECFHHILIFYYTKYYFQIQCKNLFKRVIFIVAYCFLRECTSFIVSLLFCFGSWYYEFIPAQTQHKNRCKTDLYEAVKT